MSKPIGLEELLQSLYISCLKNRRIRKVIFNGMKLSAPIKSFDYITESFECPPVRELYGLMLANYREGNEVYLSNEQIHGLMAGFKNWEADRKHVADIVWNRRIGFYIQRLLIMITMIALYYFLRNEICLYICIVVNTIGVIFAIVLDYEWTVVERISRERKIASLKGAKRKPQSPDLKLKGCFQFIAGLGLIINISLWSAQFLEQVI